MESDLHQQQQPQVNSSGLTRFKSAPSSYFNNIIDREFYEHVFNKPSSPETERVFSRFINSFGSDDDLLAQKISVDSTVKEEEEVNINQQQQQQDQGLASINNEHVVHQQSNYNNSVPSSHGFYQSSMMPPLPNQNVSSGLDGSFSMGVNRLQQVKNHGGNNSNLIRHSSSPAGLFSQINIENGYVSMRGMGTLGAVNNSMKEAKFSTARSLKNQSNYSSGLMSTIDEVGDKDNRENNLENEAFGESHGNEYMDYPVDTWDDSEMMSENVGGLKRFRDNDSKQQFSGLNVQNETGGGHSNSPLAHQLSMPNTSSEMAAMEKFLHFSDSVPMKIRAKRGCATHPRSIAERVRRTKISERMRKLQDLVPNMDKVLCFMIGFNICKVSNHTLIYVNALRYNVVSLLFLKQTNTADMLDLAVDYIKDLQKQAQKLQDCQAKCTCPHKQQQQQ
ncbi:transcription factor bHLH122-like protein [Medicago truncatula]|uniref:Transcription factor bHLH122-like protein n=2 Tax=Trifolieae TaxID=163742 RepID=A0A072VBS6_MEDTR|nr:transcription factor bHLH122-like protein [Medicago truncatula]